MRLPGKGPICVYMARWVLYSATRRQKIILHRKFLQDSGLAASTISSALNRLVDAGLISQIKRGVGQAPVIYLKKESEDREKELRAKVSYLTNKHFFLKADKKLPRLI